MDTDLLEREHCAEEVLCKAHERMVALIRPRMSVVDRIQQRRRFLLELSAGYQGVLAS